jgi:hypothetical protein
MKLTLLHYISYNILHIHINIKYLIIHFIVMSYFNFKKFGIDIINLTSLLTKSASQLDLRITCHRFGK